MHPPPYPPPPAKREHTHLWLPPAWAARVNRLPWLGVPGALFGLLAGITLWVGGRRLQPSHTPADMLPITMAILVAAAMVLSGFTIAVSSASLSGNYLNKRSALLSTGILGGAIGGALFGTLIFYAAFIPDVERKGDEFRPEIGYTTPVVLYLSIPIAIVALMTVNLVVGWRLLRPSDARLAKAVADERWAGPARRW
ncbi:hypothetical protein ACFWY9_01375 [Amycolatopsis sp. NPDC059027]|uniref:hypothetical protein n=1 Tax=Amycolatopsis sp. NPDC059027 TaxID=3346709 RepID=UPI003670657C